MVDVDSSIQSAQQRANEAQTKAESYTDSAQVAAAGYATPGPGVTVTAPTISVPPYAPNMQLGDAFKTDYNTIWADIETWVRGLMTDWMNTYFPVFDRSLGVIEDAWLKNVLENGYSGIPIVLENAIWERARSKDMLEAVRLEDEAMSQFASRGFSLPPGVLASRVIQIQIDASNKSSTIARDLAIKQIENAVEMTKMAVIEITKLRLGIAQALGDFMRAWLTVPQAAADIAKAKSQMQQFLWQSTADYINAQVAVANLSLEAQRVNASTNVELQRLSVQAFNESLGRKVNAAIEAARVMGASASAALGAQNTLVGAVTSITKNN